MKKLLELGNHYARKSDWKDFALVKFCLFSMGLAVGANISKKDKKTVTAMALVVFVATYIPLMFKLIQTATSMDD